MNRASGPAIIAVVFGVLLVLISAFALLYLYAFSSMVDPRLDGWDQWQEILSRMLEAFAWLLAIMLVVGIYQVVWGLLSIVRGSPRS